MSIVAPSPTSVYRYYDKSDLLLYVGITSRGVQRNREHNTSKAWWQFVTRQEVEHFDTRAEAMACERELIRRFSPPFNTQHNPDHAKMREAYLLFAAAVRVGPCVLFRLSSKTRHPLTDSWVHLRFNHSKQQHLVIKHVVTRLDHSDPSRCSAKCPKPRRAVA